MTFESFLHAHPRINWVIMLTQKRIRSVFGRNSSWLDYHFRFSRCFWISSCISNSCYLTFFRLSINLFARIVLIFFILLLFNLSETSIKVVKFSKQSIFFKFHKHFFFDCSLIVSRECFELLLILLIHFLIF
jgi:hypothetical protein